VAGSAVLRCFVERLHDGFFVPVEMRVDLAIAGKAGDCFAGVVDQYGGAAEYIAADAAGAGDFSNGVADHTSDAIFVIRTLYRGGCSESTGEQGCGVVAAFAVTGVGGTFGVGEFLNIFLVPRCTERVGVGGLSPLRVHTHMAVSTVCGCGNFRGLQKTGEVGRGLTGEVRIVSERKIVTGCVDEAEIFLHRGWRDRRLGMDLKGQTRQYDDSEKKGAGERKCSMR
jgi:hypothetical protein